MHIGEQYEFRFISLPFSSSLCLTHLLASIVGDSFDNADVEDEPGISGGEGGIKAAQQGLDLEAVGVPPLFQGLGPLVVTFGQFQRFFGKLNLVVAVIVRVAHHHHTA